MPGLVSQFLRMGSAWANVGRVAMANPVIRSSVYGAGIGGLAGGLFSDKGNTLGGAFKGALAGAAIGGYGRRLALNSGVRSAWNAGAGRGFMGAFGGAGKASAQVAWADARSTGRFIGRTATRAYNGFRGIFA